jgi:ferredoxin/flavodoxin
MSTVIYYYSSTGNCLSIARQIKQQLQNCKIQSITHLMNSGKIIPDAESVGFIYPMYFGTMPPVVKMFIEKTDFTDVKYIFGINSSGLSAGNSLRKLKQLLRKKGKNLNAGFFIRMPTNYLLGWYFNFVKGTENSKVIVINNAKERVNKLVLSIKNKINTSIPGNVILGFIPKMINPMILLKRANIWDAKFNADDSCRSCGTCVKICLVKNIELENNRPVWKHNCILCLGCINWCPEHAIQFGDKTKNRTRYHHPDVKVNEMYKP